MKITKLYKEALALRKQGHSFREIHEVLGIAKSTVSVWLRAVPLSKRARTRLIEVGVKGRAKGRVVLAEKRSRKCEEIANHVRSDFAGINLDVNILKLLAAVLYWAEGAKQGGGIYFTNSDPVMIRTFMGLMKKGLGTVDKKWYATLHLHEYHDVNTQKQFWSKVTGIAEDRIGIYKKPHTGTNKHPGYPGCIQVRYGDSALFKYINYMYNSLAQSMGA